MSTCRRVLALLAFAIISLPQSAFAQLINPHVFQSRVDLYPYGSTGVTESCFWKNVVYLSSDSDNNCLYSVDASDPGNLQYISRALDKGGHCNEPMVVDDILYVAAWNADIRVFDVSTPGQMNQIGWISAPGEYFWGLDVSNDRVYATQSDNSVSRHLQILDVSNPSSPSVMKKYTVPERVIAGVAVRGSYAYVANYNHLLVINISDELNPYTAKDINLGHLLACVEIRDNYLFVGSEEAAGGLYVFDISDPSDPIQVDNLPNCAARDMYLLGDYAFLAGNGLTTVRISDPTDLRALLATYMKNYTDAVSAYELTVTGNDRHIYVSDLEMYYQTVPPYDNYWKGRTYAFEVLTEDPDDAGPGKWKDLRPRRLRGMSNTRPTICPPQAIPPGRFTKGRTRGQA